MLNLFFRNTDQYGLRFFIFAVIVGIAHTGYAQSADSPDLKKENQFHQVYRAYNLNPTNEKS
jgi:hypothetical protein